MEIKFNLKVSQILRVPQLYEMQTWDFDKRKIINTQTPSYNRKTIFPGMGIPQAAEDSMILNF